MPPHEWIELLPKAGEHCGKAYRSHIDGKTRKYGITNPYGVAVPKRIDSLQDIVDRLEWMRSPACLGGCVVVIGEVEDGLQRKLKTLKNARGRDLSPASGRNLTRSRRLFFFDIDYPVADPFAHLFEVLPEFADVPMVAVTSSGSHVNGCGVKGWHIYGIADDVPDDFVHQTADTMTLRGCFYSHVVERGLDSKGRQLPPMRKTFVDTAAGNLGRLMFETVTDLGDMIDDDPREFRATKIYAPPIVINADKPIKPWPLKSIDAKGIWQERTDAVISRMTGDLSRVESGLVFDSDLVWCDGRQVTIGEVMLQVGKVRCSNPLEPAKTAPDWLHVGGGQFIAFDEEMRKVTVVNEADFTIPAPSPIKLKQVFACNAATPDEAVMLVGNWRYIVDKANAEATVDDKYVFACQSIKFAEAIVKLVPDAQLRVMRDASNCQMFGQAFRNRLNVPQMGRFCSGPCPHKETCPFIAQRKAFGDARIQVTTIAGINRFGIDAGRINPNKTDALVMVEPDNRLFEVVADLNLLVGYCDDVLAPTDYERQWLKSDMGRSSALASENPTLTNCGLADEAAARYELSLHRWTISPKAQVEVRVDFFGYEGSRNYGAEDLKNARRMVAPEERLSAWLRDCRRPVNLKLVSTIPEIIALESSLSCEKSDPQEMNPIVDAFRHLTGYDFGNMASDVVVYESADADVISTTELCAVGRRLKEKVSAKHKQVLWAEKLRAAAPQTPQATRWLSVVPIDGKTSLGRFGGHIWPLQEPITLMVLGNVGIAPEALAHCAAVRGLPVDDYLQSVNSAHQRRVMASLPAGSAIVAVCTAGQWGEATVLDVVLKEKKQVGSAASVAAFEREQRKRAKPTAAGCP